MLIGIKSATMKERETVESLAELSRLAETLGLAVADSHLVRLRTPTAALLVGRGKADELAAAISELADEADSGQEYLVPNDRHDLVALAHLSGRILRQEYGERGVQMHARLTGRALRLLSPYRLGRPE